ncbi:GIP [Symbiodinium sp. CCMP2456]|nr:GIP [Symbiodinium sp. CCMP2456]
MSEKDPFKDLAFSGAPSEYRLFRRKILLSVASLEEKHLYLAGPRILNRLQGEAWRATEHLSIGELRTEQGWLKVLRALDDHYRYLPETELNECVDEFLFHLKRRGNEGPTAFVSRFKAVLSRLETLVAAERAQQKGSTKRQRPADKHADSEAEQQSSSLSSDHAKDDDDEDELRLTKDRVAQAAAASDQTAAAKASPGPTTDSKGPKTVGSFIDSPKGKKKTPSSGGGSHRSRGTHRADEERANRRMLEDLGKLEVGHLRVKPIFPEVILGHLFMRKYGLTREQRSQVIRSTGGSCKFKDVEKVIRASDYEDKMNEPGTRHAPPRQGRSSHVLAAEEGSSLSEPTYSDDEEVQEAAESFDEEGDEELEEAYEVQKRAKHEAKRAYRSYKDSRKKVREIKKERQPYMPVVALPPNASAPSDALPVQPTFKYDKKPPRRPGKDAKGGRKGRREDVNMIETEPLSEFLYMVSAVSEEKTSENEIVLEICSVTVPAGLAVIDTGCTTSVVGEDTARRYQIYFRERGLPEPQEISLPPVQLKGFDGTRTSTSKGLRWTVKLGKLWGQVTTYSVPGQAPFLLSRKVLQGMEATIDLGKCTMTSVKHGIQDEPLMQAPNGHLLIPLVPSDGVEDLLQVREVPPCCAGSRAVFERPGACIFAYCYGDASQEEARSVESTQATCGTSARTVLAKRQKERPFLRLFEQTWSLQTMLGPAYEVDFDMCAVGLLDRKLVESLDKCKCPGHAEHAHLTGQRHAQCSEVYPRKLCRRIASVFASRDKHVTPTHDIFLETDEEADSERESEPEEEAEGNPAMQEANRRSYAAMIQKLHVNTGHASVPQMLRLAQRAKAPDGVVAAIRKFKCPVCEELQVPPSHRVAALKHTETPNHIVGLDVVQVELKRDTSTGIVEQKYNVLTAVDYATDFAQQIVLPAGPGVVSRAFHSLWCRPYGPPRVVYVDPDQRWMSGEFQEYLRQNSITLLDSATESHWQLGRVENQGMSSLSVMGSQVLNGFWDASLGSPVACPTLLSSPMLPYKMLSPQNRTLLRKCKFDNKLPKPLSRPMRIPLGPVP